MPSEPFLATAGGRRVRCLHCGGEWFWHRRVVMSSGTATLFRLDSFSPEAAVLSCTACGRLELFESAAVQLLRPAD